MNFGDSYTPNIPQSFSTNKTIPPQPIPSSQAETPRTDSARKRAMMQYQRLYPDNPLRPVNDADMAELERELTAAEKNCANTYSELNQRIDNLREQIEHEEGKHTVLQEQLTALKLANGKAVEALKSAHKDQLKYGGNSHDLIEAALRDSLPSTLYARYKRMEQALDELVILSSTRQLISGDVKRIATSILNQTEGE